MSSVLELYALISECGNYRYLLKRTFKPGLFKKARKICCFIMHNPSNADGEVDDPTTRRCMQYAKDWGCSELYIINRFAWRSTVAGNLHGLGNDAVGLDNDTVMRAVLREVKASDGLTVAAWGSFVTSHEQHAKLLKERTAFVIDMCKEMEVPLHYLTLSESGHPAHPLYQRADLRPTPWQ